MSELKRLLGEALELIDDLYNPYESVSEQCRWENGVYGCECCEKDRQEWRQALAERGKRVRDFLSEAKEKIQEAPHAP